MPSLTIRHLTAYRYRRAVAFGEHRMMLHPGDSHEQKVVQADLKISPKPRSLRFVQDAFGNQVGIARFSCRSTELSFESIVRLEHSRREMALDLKDAGRAFPVGYRVSELRDLAPYIERHQHDPMDEVGDGLGDFAPKRVHRRVLSFSHGCHKAFITASFTGGEKRRASSWRQRRCDLAMGVAATSPC